MGQWGINDECIEVSGTGGGDCRFGALRTVTGGDDMWNVAQLPGAETRRSPIEFFAQRLALAVEYLAADFAHGAGSRNLARWLGWNHGIERPSRRQSSDRIRSPVPPRVLQRRDRAIGSRTLCGVTGFQLKRPEVCFVDPGENPWGAFAYELPQAPPTGFRSRIHFIELLLRVQRQPAAAGSPLPRPAGRQ